MPPTNNGVRSLSVGRMASHQAPQRVTVATAAIEAIRERILTGEYPEGSPLRQDALAKELGMSRIPVREALRQLETEGLVSLQPHVGAIVSTLSLPEIKELFEVRALIEGDLLRRSIPLMEQEHITEAEETLQGYEIALEEREVSAWGEWNWKFHSIIYSPAGQPLTMGIIQNLHNHSDRYLRMQLALTRGEIRASEEHRAILAAVKGKEVEYARSLLTAHILGASRSLLEFLSERRKPGE